MTTKKYPPKSAIEDFLSYMVGVERCSKKTVAAYAHDLQKFLLTINEIEDIGLVTREMVEVYLASIPPSENGSTSNYNRKLSSLHSLFSYLERKDIGNPTSGLKPARSHKRQISYLSEEERERLLKTVEMSATPFYRKRDIAIFSIFLSLGIRVSELVGLEIDDITFNKNGCSYLKIIRKGGGEESLPISEKVSEKLKKYVLSRKETKHKKVFLSKSSKPLTPSSVYYLVRMYLIKSGIKKAKMGPHMLRHSVGVSLLKKGVNLVTIQKLLGHRRLDTTSIYLHIEQKDIEAAVELTTI